jgi:signal transduction histidine kinase
MGDEKSFCRDGKFLHPETEKLFHAFIDRSRYSALGVLVKGIIHNLNGSLQVLSMHMELLQEMLTKEADKINSSAPKKIEKCLEHIDKLKGMIEILIQKGSHDEQDDPQAIHLNDLLEEKLSLLHHHFFFKHQVEVKKVFSPQLPYLRGHYIDFDEGVSSLIQNAMEAMEETPQKELTLKTEIKDGHIRVIIKDTGCGISEEIRSNLFQPFFTTKGAGHYGLGLFMARELLTPYGGAFNYTSREGETLFTISFPLQSAHSRSFREKGR